MILLILVILGMYECCSYTNTEMVTGVIADPDIQYGYTGTSAHGILTDYIGDATFENIKIDNVWYGNL